MLKVSTNIRTHKINKNNYFLWNKFFPYLLLVNEKLLNLLKNFKLNKRKKLGKTDIVKRLYKYKILYYGKVERFEDDFVATLYKKLYEIDKEAKEFYKYKKPYSSFAIVNDICNLNCPYCIKKYRNDAQSILLEEKEKLNLLILLFEQFINRKIQHNDLKCDVIFNGGEILTEWPLIKKFIETITGKYPHVVIRYHLNTNMTLMNKEIAKFMSKFNFFTSASIDGYKSAHNRTRKYYNGKGSFNDVITGIITYNKFNKKHPINSFQGTIEYPDLFKVEKLLEMSKYGFKSVRLAPNLLNCTEEDGIEKAKLLIKLLTIEEEKIKFTESIFYNIKKLINQKEYKFYFNCLGLSGFPKARIGINISSMRLFQLCSYISKASVPIKLLNYDIYNPILWEASFNFIKDRVDSIIKNCIDCEIVGICRGGCILDGLDNENNINKAACSFRKELWKRFLMVVYKANFKD
jgi:radical SAM protein with 4Fe4S-binding SPASM domain